MVAKKAKKKKQAIQNGRRGNLFWMDPDDLLIVDDSSNILCQKERNDRPLDAGFVASIRAHGILHTVQVRKDGPHLQIVLGRQRVRAARHINANGGGPDGNPIEVPVMVFHGTDGEAFDAMLTENLARQDDPPSVVADYLVRGIKFGRSIEQLALAAKCSVATVRERIKLASAASEVRKAVDDGVIAEVQARQLTALTREDQRKALEEMVASGATRGAKARQIVRQKVDGDPGKETGARMMTRVQKNQWLTQLGKSEHELAGLAVSVLRFSMGDTEALGGKYRGLRPQAEDAGKAE